MPKAKVKAMSARGRSDAEESGGLVAFLIRPILNNPKDAIAILAAAAMVAAIAGNALFMQAGRHPSPMFGSHAAVSFSQAPLDNPRPRARPAAAAEAKPAELRAEPRQTESRQTESRQIESRQVEHKQPEPRANDPMGQLVAKTVSPGPAATVTAVPRPPAPIPAASKTNDPVAALIASQRRVAAVQRTLTEFGYAQLKPTGVAGSETQAAIAKFEKERKLPVTGQMSDRMVRELTAVTGRPIE